MRFLVTGVAGFIGFHVAKRLLEMGYSVIGLDNENDYYDVTLKLARISELKKIEAKSSCSEAFEYIVADITDAKHIDRIAQHYYRVDGVCHLAAQAGVRYSIDNPKRCMDINVMGFMNIIHAFRHVPRFVYASSSSVYGNMTPPLKSSETGSPLSPYAASKQANESIAESYREAFGLDCIGLRYFSVYGPWGRPDMAAFIFIEKLLAGQSIDLYNNGEMYRDWTYIDDVATATTKALVNGRECIGKIENVARGRAEKLTDFVDILAEETGFEVLARLLPMQKGDIHTTEADNSILDTFDIKPTALKDGLRSFVQWHKASYPKKWEKAVQRESSQAQGGKCQS